MHTDIAIIGGGLAGLSLARQLSQMGQDFLLFEARDRLGGRIASVQQDSEQERSLGLEGYDLGPSWFWPGQHRMERLVQDLGLTRFDQYASGAILFETETGEVLRNLGFASMQGAWRLQSGMRGLIDGIAQQLPPERLHLNHAVTKLTQDGKLTFKDGSSCQAERIILALPPRLAAELSFAPALSRAQLQALTAIPTWMGGQAKFVALYDQPFWREDGFSGDAISRSGPLAEIHDASPPQTALNSGAPAALFGFLGLPAPTRQGKAEAITRAAIAQLTRLFGPKAAQPIRIAYQDWAQEHYTAAPIDQSASGQHPAYGLPAALQDVWNGRISLCVSEVASEMGGYLEGALAAAEEQSELLQKERVDE
ncbi:FAD-dependent oxidoreductase [Pseudophaeobacter sp.]|uniref:flavin monoamine oxidase family protein n=1 Tax=Pseudophaeobacter sp. TaxID=1971739 RepID=UPI003296EB71